MEKLKESKELIDALYLLYKFGEEASKDGLDWSDAAALGAKIINDAEFRDRLAAGFQGVKPLGDELKDLSFKDGMELVNYVTSKLK